MFNMTERANTSPSRTYMIGVFESFDPPKIHVKKVVLPKATPNSIKNAKFCYLLDDINNATNTQFAFCVPIEEYLRVASSGPFTEEEQEYLNPSLKMITEKEKEDIDLTLKMLYEWNSKQKIQYESYNEILTILLNRVSLINDFKDQLRKLKEIAIVLTQLE